MSGEGILENNKIALVSCSGLSPLGLVVRVATIELALDKMILSLHVLLSIQHNQINVNPY